MVALAAGTAAGRPVFASGARGDAFVRIWDATTGGPRSVLPQAGPVRAVVFAGPDDGVLVTAGVDGVVGRWDPATGAPIGAPLPGGAGPVAALASARLGERSFVAAAGADRRLRVWDAATGAPHAELDTTREITGLALTALEGRLVALVIGKLRPPESDHNDLVAAALWDLASGAELREPAEVSFSGGAGAFGVLDGRPIVVRGADYWYEDGGHVDPDELADLEVRDLATDEEVSFLSRPDYGFTQAVALLTTRAGRTLGFSAGDSRVIAWDPGGGADPGLLREFGPALVHSLAVTEVDLAGTPRVAVAAGAGDQVHVWHPEGLDR